MPRITHPSVCIMDCPDTCSLSVQVEDDRIVSIGPSDVNPTTQGFICSKVANYKKRVYADERIQYPMRRTGAKGAGEFERIEWSEAGAIIAEKLSQVKDKWGGESILPFYYGGSNGLLGQETSDQAFFAKLGASRLALTVCAAPTTEMASAMYGKMPGIPFEEYPHAKLIVIWGANPKASNIHLVPYLRKAKSAGAKIVAVDPFRNFSNNEVDLHLQIYPGTDVAVALAMVNYWRERDLLDRDFIMRHTKGSEQLLQMAEEYTVEHAAKLARIAPEQIEKLAKMYAFHDPALLRVGWGLERNRNGGASVGAVLALPAVLGKFGSRGAGYTLSNSGAYKVAAGERLAGIPWQKRILNMTRLGTILLKQKNPEIKALFVYNCNPAVTIPAQKAVMQGLAREDLFTIVSEQVMTDTAKFADVLLPATTFLEQEELRNGYGTYATQYLAPVIKRIGESKPNEEMFAFLGRAMGWEESAFTENTEDYLQRAVKSIKGLGQDIDLAELREKGIAHFKKFEPVLVQFGNAFPQTSDEKIDLAPERYINDIYRYNALPTDGHPLALISPATDKLINSTLGEFNLPELILKMHPVDAQQRNINEGDDVRVYNDLGEILVRLRIDDHVRPGVVTLPKGAWRKASKNGWTATVLVPDAVSPIGKGACFNDARVEVAAI